MARIEALIVAINDYGDPRNNLNSCIADAAALEGILREVYGFQRVTSLIDGDATIANVDAALTALFAGARPEDRLLFFYSGHGYQLQKGESREEVLVLRDGFYEDDRLSLKTQALPPGVLTVILDSCFSGGMDKVLIPGPDGFDLALSKMWKPNAELVRRENEELLKAQRVVFKGFGRAPAVMPAAVAKAFTVEAPFFPPPGGAPKGPQPPSAVQPDITEKSFPAQPPTAGAATSGTAQPPAPPSPPPAAGGAVGMSDAAVEAAAKAMLPNEEGQVQINGILITASSENETASAKTSKTDGLSAFTYGLREVLKEGAWHGAPRAILPRVTGVLRGIGIRQTPLLIEPIAPRESGATSFILIRPAQAAGSGQVPQWMQPMLTGMTGRPNMATTTTQNIDPNLIAQIIAMINATQQARAAQPGMPMPGAIGTSPSMLPVMQQPYFGAPVMQQDPNKGFFDVLRRAGELAMQYGPQVYNAVQQVLNKGMQPDLAGLGAQLPAQYGQMPISPIYTMTPDQQKGFWDVVRRAGELAVQYGPDVYNAVQNILSKGVQPQQPIAPIAPTAPTAPIAPTAPMQAEDQAKFWGALATIGSLAVQYGPSIYNAISSLTKGMQPGVPYPQVSPWGVPMQPTL